MITSYDLHYLDHHALNDSSKLIVTKDDGGRLFTGKKIREVEESLKRNRRSAIKKEEAPIPDRFRGGIELGAPPSPTFHVVTYHNDSGRFVTGYIYPSERAAKGADKRNVVFLPPNLAHAPVNPPSQLETVKRIKYKELVLSSCGGDPDTYWWACWHCQGKKHSFIIKDENHHPQRTHHPIENFRFLPCSFCDGVGIPPIPFSDVGFQKDQEVDNPLGPNIDWLGIHTDAASAII